MLRTFLSMSVVVLAVALIAGSAFAGDKQQTRDGRQIQKRDRTCQSVDVALDQQVTEQASQNRQRKRDGSGDGSGGGEAGKGKQQGPRDGTGPRRDGSCQGGS